MRSFRGERGRRRNNLSEVNPPARDLLGVQINTLLLIPVIGFHGAKCLHSRGRILESTGGSEGPGISETRSRDSVIRNRSISSKRSRKRGAAIRKLSSAE